MNPQEVYDYTKQESVIKFLSDKAETKIKKMRTEGGVLDVIETHLAYLQIGSDLGLNLRANGMVNSTFQRNQIHRFSFIKNLKRSLEI